MKKNKRNISRILWTALLIGILSAVTVSAADYQMDPCNWRAEEGKQIAKWSKTDPPSGFMVGLFKDGAEEACSWHGTKYTAYDFTDEIKKLGTGIYYFQVYPENGGQEKAVASPKINVVVNPGAATNYYFRAGSWEKIHDKWYYFNDDAMVATGWQLIGGKWYYLEPEGTSSMSRGALYVSCTTPDGYQVNADGEWTEGPREAAQAENSWYQLRSSDCLWVWLPRPEGGFWNFSSSNRNLLDCTSVGEEGSQFVLTFASNPGNGEEVDLTFQSPKEKRSIKARIEKDASITLLQ